MTQNANIEKYLKTERCEYLVDFLDLPEATEVDGAKWERFQIQHLNDDSLFRIEDKSRQIAWSWLAAAEAVACAILSEQSSLFISINLDEAKEKIRYVKRIYEALRDPHLPAIVTDNQQELEFEGGARLISMPSRPPRGKARFRVYLDEFAHAQHDKAIYTAALPVISKGGCIRIGSSPLGASGIFWEIFTESLKTYSGYTRKKTPWWEIESFCLDVPAAVRFAPDLSTKMRVERYGNERIVTIFENSLLEDFQQEYEAAFVDETTAWITWDEIKAAQSEEMITFAGSDEGGVVDNCFRAIGELKAAIAAGRVEPVYYGGMDIGRTRNTTEIFLIGKSTTDEMPLRLMLTLDNCDFDAQTDVLSKVLFDLPVAKLLIDRNGLGRQLSEAAEKKFPSKAEGVDFTNASKELWATDAKMYFQKGKMQIPATRELGYQIHSIKKKVTASKNNVFDTERNEKHHADKFWTLALAINAAHQPVFQITDRERQLFALIK